MADLGAELATFIAEADRDNELGPAQLAGNVARWLRQRGVVAGEAAEHAVDDFVYEALRGTGYRQPKRLGPDALATAIIHRFNLNREHP